MIGLVAIDFLISFFEGLYGLTMILRAGIILISPMHAVS